MAHKRVKDPILRQTRTDLNLKKSKSNYYTLAINIQG